MAATFIFSEASFADVQSTQTTRNQCRICLAEVLGEHPQLCACKGHLRNIHQRCLLEWIRRSITLQELADGATRCEICRAKIRLDVATTYECTHLTELVDNINKKNCDLNTKSAFLLCLFLVTFITLLITAANYSQNEQKQEVLLYLVISLTFVSFFALVYIVKCILVKEKHELRGIKPAKTKLFPRSNGKVTPLTF